MLREARRRQTRGTKCECAVGKWSARGLGMSCHSCFFLALIGSAAAQITSAPSARTDFIHSAQSRIFTDDVLGERLSPTTHGTEDLDQIHERLKILLDEGAHDAGAWEKDVASMQKRVVDMFYHAYDNYMLHAFPHDELLPLSCHFVDNFGGYALTLVDSLDMLAVLGNRTEFSRAVGLLKEHLSFDLDVCISVFETNIRVMGGLLSGHLLALDSRLQLMPTYDGCLLDMALDLGKRLLPGSPDLLVRWQ